MTKILTLTLTLLTASIADSQNWYPVYHIAAEQGWINDPNGLSYFNGYYHAFFQHNPYAPQSGLMHWGHAISTDMLHWEYLPIALTPSLTEDIDGIFSGSAVVKDNNLTLLYTGVSENGTRQRQLAATSATGEDFHKLGVIIDGENEVNFRDPKAWYQDDNWYVVIGSQTNQTRGEVLLYKSADLNNWTYVGQLAQANETFGYMWECPDFFTLNGKQILVTNPQGINQRGYDYQNLYQTGYYVGTWSPETGSNYTIEKDFREIDHGHDFYATQTFLAPDGRRIMIGWMDMWEQPFPERKDGWAGMLTLPRELTLSESGDLLVRPISEIVSARGLKKSNLKNVETSSYLLLDDQAFSSEILIEFDMTETTSNLFGVELTSETPSAVGVQVYVNSTENRIFLNRYYPKYNITSSSRSVPLDLSLPTLTLDIFVDRSSIEVFINDGQAVMSSRIYPEDDQRYFGAFIVDGSMTINSYDKWDF